MKLFQMQRLNSGKSEHKNTGGRIAVLNCLFTVNKFFSLCPDLNARK